jgi:hypothetical protein
MKQESLMKQGVAILLVIFCLADMRGEARAQERSATSSAAADSVPDASGRSDGVPIEKIIAAVAFNTG